MRCIYTTGSPVSKAVRFESRSDYLQAFFGLVTISCVK